MKRILSVIVLLALVSIPDLTLAQFDAESTNGYDYCVFSDGFEDEAFSKSVWETHETEKSGENTYAKISADAPSICTEVTQGSYLTLAKNRIRYEFMLRFPSACDASVSLTDGEKEYPLITFSKDASIADKWIKYVVFLSFDKGTVTIYADGECEQNDLPLTENLPISTESKIEFSVDGNGIMYADNISMRLPLYDNTTLSFKEKMFSATYEEGYSITDTHNTKGIIRVEPATAQEENHENTAVLYNYTEDGTLTDAFLYGGYRAVNPKWETELLTAEKSAAMKKVVFDIEVYFREVAASTINVIGHISANERKAVPLIKFTDDGYFKTADGEKYAYQAGKWYSFRFYIDLENSVYTACVSGNLLGTDIKLENSNFSYILSCGFQINNMQTEKAVEIDRLSYFTATEKSRKNFVVTKSAENKINVCHIGKEGAVLIIAVFDENDKFKKVSICENKEKDLRFYAADTEYLPTDKVYYMFWDGLTSISPLNIKQKIN